MSTDNIAAFDALLRDYDVVFGLVYRGHWCPFCLSHIRALKAIEERIHHAKGQTVIITSEMEENLPAVREATGYKGPAIVDTENVLIKELVNRKIADVAISSMPIRRYDHGMAQPAVFVMKADGTVLFSWAIVPGLMNLGGAKDRPVLSDVWDNAEAQLEDRKVPHSTVTTTGVWSILSEKIWGV